MTSRIAYAVLTTVAALACSSPAIVHDSRVAIRQRTGDDDSALVVAYDARVCSLTFRDPTGTLGDLREEDSKRVPTEMAREMPGPEWEMENSGYPSHLFTVFAFPPGHYEIVEIASTEAWEELEGEPPPPRAVTHCDGRLKRQRVQMPFRIDRGQVTLIGVPNGPASFDNLTTFRLPTHFELIRERVGSWFPSIARASHARFRELAASQRQPRNGYDVYPACNHKTAVVRNTGTQADWERGLDSGMGRHGPYGRPIFGIPSVHATGFGRGCVRKWAYHLMLTDALEVPAGIEAVGAWLVEQDIAGEVDLMVTGIPRVLTL